MPFKSTLIVSHWVNVYFLSYLLSFIDPKIHFHFLKCATGKIKIIYLAHIIAVNRAFLKGFSVIKGKMKERY